MDKENELKRVYDSRLLNSDCDMNNFEEGIANLLSLNDPSILLDLLKVFDDNTENTEVMYGLLHAIETYDKHYYIAAMLNSFDIMLQNASVWLLRLHYGILNSDSTRIVYSKILAKFDDKELLKRIVSFLRKIKEEDPDFFKEKVDDILSKLT